MGKRVVIIGYSGHAFVVCDIFNSIKKEILGYCDQWEINQNPYNLPYFGKESSSIGLEKIRNNEWFISIGNNQIRKKIFDSLMDIQYLENPINAIHKTAYVSPMTRIGRAVMIGPNAIVNSQSQIRNGVIINSGAIVEHECQIGNFAHIAPGAVLAGNVSVGEQSFIGANSVIKQGISIGNNVTVGAGSVVIRNIPDGHTVAGNPTRIIQK